MRSTVIVTFLVALAPSMLLAQENDTERAQNLYHRATLAFEAEEWSEAADLYERAYQVEALPELLYNLALCRERNHQDEEALAAYRAYVEAAPEGAPKRDEALSRANTIETRLNAPVEVTPPESPEPSVEPSNALPIALVAAGGAALVTAAGTLIGRLALRARLRDACFDGACEGPQHGLVDRYDRLGVSSWVLLGLGGAAILTGALLWSSGDSNHEIATDGRRLILRGRF